MRPEIQTLIPLFIALPLTMSVLVQLFARRRAMLAAWMAMKTATSGKSATSC